MHLSYEQGNLFFDVMDGLLLYVNDRFHIVEDFDFDDDDPMLEMKTALVTSFVWDNISVIQDYVASSTDLDANARELALSWTHPLKDTFTLVRYQEGCAIVMNRTGVFRVCGIVDDFDDSTGRVPALMRAVLLPFGDLIIYDGFLSMSDVPLSQERALQDTFEDMCTTHGIATRGDQLIERAIAFNEERASAEFDAFFDSLADPGQKSVETLPEGFHRGALAGASEIERERLVSSHRLESSSSQAVTPLSTLKARAWEHVPVTSFVQCLELFGADKLYEACESLDIRGYRGKGLDDIRRDIANALLAYPDDLQDALLWCEEGQFETARIAAQSPVLAFKDDEADRFKDIWPLLPYTYLFHHDGMFSLVVPDEVRPMLSRIDFDSFAKARRDSMHALYSAVACIVYSGIVSLDEAYAQYARLDEAPIPFDAFRDLVSGEASYGDLSFEVWQYEGTAYLVHYTLCDDYVAQQVVQQHADIALPQIAAGGRAEGPSYQSVLSDIRRGIGKEMDNAQSIRLSLLEAHASFQMKPIDPVMMERDAYDVLCECESVRILRDYLDERVPDGEDDYTFADRAVQGIVATAVEVGDRQALLSYVDEIGLAGCSADSRRFESMLMRVFDDMPSWENNGWTVSEITERLTGRHVFYDALGNVIRVGANDPCPCGSGKKYGDCHGRRR